jgi:glycosyltransferase involved in cell wall biosynthesis
MTDRSIVGIIPLFNGARCIGGAIRRVFAQTIQSNEFIVVDDGSTDSGPAIVQKLAHESRITPLRKLNWGQSAARNTVCRASRGAFFALGLALLGACSQTAGS